MFWPVKKITLISVFWVFLYIFLAALFLKVSLEYLDPDFGWHLKVGQEIVQSGRLPSANNFNYTFQGNWVDHEWLSNVFIYKVYSTIGYPALSLIFVALILATLVLLNWFAWRTINKKSTLIYIILFQALGVRAALGHTGLRVQELAWLLLLLLLIIIYYFNKDKKWWRLFFLPPLFYLWANLHASFLVGLFVLFFWFGIKILENILARWPGKERLSYLDFSSLLPARETLIFSFFSALTLGVTFLTPYRLALYDFLAGYGQTAYLNIIQEWWSPWKPPLDYWKIFYLGLVVLALFIYVYNIWQKKHWRFNLWSFSLIVLFFVLSCQSRRHFPLLFISSFTFLVEIYATVIYLKVNPFIGPWHWTQAYLLICLMVLILVSALPLRFIKEPFSSYCADYPCQAVEFLKQHPEYTELKIFNSYGWGGFLIETYSERKLFIDGRLPQVAYAGHTFLEEYLDFFKPGLAPLKLDQYNIGLILIESQDRDLKFKKWEKFLFRLKDKKAKNYLREYLAASPDWQIVFQDKVSVIYLRK